MKDIEETLTLDEKSAVDFVAELRKGWARTIYPALYSDVVQSNPIPKDLEDATKIVQESPLYPWFSHLERAQQKMMWRTMGDIVLKRNEILPGILNVENPVYSSLEVDENFQMPQWYVDTDIHVQPGSFFIDDSSAFIYEMGARVVMLRDNDGYKFHKLFAETALPEVPGATKIVDVGCGFGKSTQVLPVKYPGADVVGIDLSVPNLKLAHAHSEARHQKVHWKLGASYDTGLEDNSVDVVTGSMVLHEMPKQQIEATLREAARILKPGGYVRFLEFWPTGNLYRDVTVYEHAERNNEPFFRDLFDTECVEILEESGMVDALWIPFDEVEAGLLDRDRPERSEWHFPWAVLSAQKTLTKGVK